MKIRLSILFLLITSTVAHATVNRVMDKEPKQLTLIEKTSINDDCDQGIALLPMYGNKKKCQAQLDADADFLSQCDGNYPKRSDASFDMLNTGWMYLHRGDYDTAMRRFNQAWLLDSASVFVYASFVVLQDLRAEVDDAKRLLDMSLTMIGNREEPKDINNNKFETSSNEHLVEFIVANAGFAFKKTQNIELSRYLYSKLDTTNLSQDAILRLKKKLEADVPNVR